jgi:hypothetical protein
MVEQAEPQLSVVVPIEEEEVNSFALHNLPVRC